MRIFRTDKQRYEDIIASLQDAVTSMSSRLAALEKEEPTEGNRFRWYDEIIGDIKDICNNNTGFGLFGADVLKKHAAYILGQGMNINEKEKGQAEKEKEFIESMIEVHAPVMSIHSIVEQFLKEGKILIKLKYDEEYEEYEDENKGENEGEKRKGMVFMEVLPYIDYGYTIIVDDNGLPKKCVFNNSDENDIIDRKNFVYRRINGEINKINTAMPPIARVLENVIALGRALFDLRQLDHLFSLPKPDLECGEVNEAKEMDRLIQARGGFSLTSKKIETHTGKFSLVTPQSYDGADKLIEEVKVNGRIISQNTGIPFYILTGFEDDLKNKNVTGGLGEGVNYSIEDIRTLIEGMFTEIYRKAVVLANGTYEKMDPRKIEGKIDGLGNSDYERVRDIYHPLATDRKLSTKTLHELTPGVDPIKEEERLALENDIESNRIKQDDIRAIMEATRMTEEEEVGND